MLSATRQRCESRLYPQLKQVLDLATQEGCKAELTYVTWKQTGWDSKPRPVNRNFASPTPYRSANMQTVRTCASLRCRRGHSRRQDYTRWSWLLVFDSTECVLTAKLRATVEWNRFVECFNRDTQREWTSRFQRHSCAAALPLMVGRSLLVRSGYVMSTVVRNFAVTM